MAKFNGKNDMTSPMRLFYERAQYRIKAAIQPDGVRPPQVKNFNFVEDVLYGRVDTRLDTVYPKEERLKILFSDVDHLVSPRVIDFVADAFDGVKHAFISARENNHIINNDPFLSDIKIFRAYQDPQIDYSNYINVLMEEYISDFLYAKRERKDVLNLRQYINKLERFIFEKPGHNPLTFSSWQRSRHSSIFTSGIAIDIAGLPIDEDATKERLFLQNPNFEYFMNVCMAHGFLVSQNAPWILVADILSPALQQYSTQYLIFSPEEVFADYYNYAYNIDTLLLQRAILESYNLFCNRFPVEKQVYTTCNIKATTRLLDRHSLEPTQFKSQYSDLEWIMFYAKMRNFEENDAINSSLMNKITRDAKKINNILDISKSIGYINSEIRKIHKSKHGGLNQVARRLRSKKILRDGKSPRSSNATTTTDIGKSDY